MKHAGLLLLVLVSMGTGCDSSTNSGSNPLVDAGGSGTGPISLSRTATAADVDAMLKAWCDWDVRCSSNFPTGICDERRAGWGQAKFYAAEALAALAACFPTLTCDDYEDRCLEPVATRIASASPSRSDFLGACWDLDKRCTGEGELNLIACFWLTMAADWVFPQVEACLAKPCSQTMSCMRALN